VWEEKVTELRREVGEVLRREEKEKAGHGAGSVVGERTRDREKEDAARKKLGKRKEIRKEKVGPT
jgi:hypothetical protein